MKRLVLIGFAALLAAMTAACNTMAGAGEDLQNLGSSITGKANENR